jgi:putative redox protein
MKELYIMDAKVVLQDGMKFIGTANSTEETGLSLQLDAGPSVGGENAGFRPLELMMISLVGCTAMDVISILRKKRQEITGFEVKVHADQTDKHPHVFTQAQIEYVITGRDIKPDAVKRAIELSENTYCPAQAMLKQLFPMELTFTINEAEG